MILITKELEFVIENNEVTRTRSIPIIPTLVFKELLLTEMGRQEIS